MTPHQLRANAQIAIADGPVTFARFARDLGMSPADVTARLPELRGVVEVRDAPGAKVVYGRLRGTAHRFAPFGCWPASSTIEALIEKERRLGKKRATDRKSDAKKREEWRLAG